MNVKSDKKTSRSAKSPILADRKFILAALAALLVLAAVYIFLRQQANQALTGPPMSSAILAPRVSPSPTLSAVASSSAQNLIVLANGRAMKVYKSPSYDFSFTYPASLGDVLGQTIPAAASPGSNCQSQGNMFVGAFSLNAHLDFGYITGNYHSCGGESNSLLQTLKFYVSGNQLRLYPWNSQVPPQEVPLVETMPVDSPHKIEAYVFKNFIDADGAGAPAAIVPSPTHQTGDLVFRIHYGSGSDVINFQEGLALLEAVIKK